jgi:hypothetical protein
MWLTGVDWSSIIAKGAIVIANVDFNCDLNRGVGECNVSSDCCNPCLSDLLSVVCANAADPAFYTH